MRKWITNYSDYLYAEHIRQQNAPFYKSVTDLIFYGVLALLITICACAYVHYKLDITPAAPWTVEQETAPEKPINFYWER